MQKTCARIVARNRWARNLCNCKQVLLTRGLEVESMDEVLNSHQLGHTWVTELRFVRGRGNLVDETVIRADKLDGVIDGINLRQN